MTRLPLASGVDHHAGDVETDNHGNGTIQKPYGLVGLTHHAGDLETDNHGNGTIQKPSRL